MFILLFFYCFVRGLRVTIVSRDNGPIYKAHKLFFFDIFLPSLTTLLRTIFGDFVLADDDNDVYF